MALQLIAAAPAPVAPPRIAHVTVVLMENRDYHAIVGNPHARFFNTVLARDGVLLTNSHAVAHPSEPNYLALFSGSTQALRDDSCPHTFTGGNVGAQTIAAGQTFGGYAESMPHDGFAGCWGSLDLYARKHVPWANFSSVPAADSRVYRGLPSPMPSLLWIIPNMCNDMHDCSTQTGDDWMREHLAPLLAWNAAHDGLLVVTWDEADPDEGGNRIPTVLVGPMLQAGSYDGFVDDYVLLRTIETALRLSCIGDACRVPPMTGIWR